MRQSFKTGVVLSKCGNHFLELMKENNDKEVEVIVVHLFPTVLKELYIL